MVAEERHAQWLAARWQTVKAARDHIDFASAQRSGIDTTQQREQGWRVGRGADPVQPLAVHRTD
jgi:hypothetical protein